VFGPEPPYEPTYEQSMQTKIAEIYSSKSEPRDWGCGTETFNDFTIIYSPGRGGGNPFRPDLSVQHVPSRTWKRYTVQYYGIGGVAALKEASFNYPSGFDKAGPKVTFNRTAAGTGDIEPADELLAPAHSFRHKLGYPKEFRVESAYGDDHEMQGICVKVTHIKSRTWDVFPGLRSELAKLNTIADLDHPESLCRVRFGRGRKTMASCGWSHGNLLA
jgi:hypothetical protein